MLRQLYGHAALLVSIRPGAKLFDNPPNIAALCERYGVAHLELFGSATSSEFNPGFSDVDFLFELDAQTQGFRACRWIELAEALHSLRRVS